jgi:hypothetical protein
MSCPDKAEVVLQLSASSGYPAMIRFRGSVSILDDDFDPLIGTQIS